MPTLAPSDIERLRIIVEEVGPGEWLTEEEAIDAAWSVYRERDPEVIVSASLYRVTDPKTLGASPEVNQRPVWIVKFDGIQDQAPMPYPPGDASPEVIRLTKAYTFVDAENGRGALSPDHGVISRQDSTFPHSILVVRDAFVRLGQGGRDAR